MDTSDWITGQIFFRDTGTRGEYGRRRMFFVGIIDVPDGVPIKEENQYTIYTDPPKLFSPLIVPLVVSIKSEQDRTIEVRGRDASGLLTYPMWRT